MCVLSGANQRLIFTGSPSLLQTQQHIGVISIPSHTSTSSSSSNKVAEGSENKSEGSEIEWLTQGNSWNTCIWSSKLWILNHRSLTSPPRWTIMSNTPNNPNNPNNSNSSPSPAYEVAKIGELISHSETPEFKVNVELVTVHTNSPNSPDSPDSPGEELEFNAALVYPPGFDPSKSYPVISYVYGGPHLNVIKSDITAYYFHQWFSNNHPR